MPFGPSLADQALSSEPHLSPCLSHPTPRPGWVAFGIPTKIYREQDDCLKTVYLGLAQHSTAQYPTSLETCLKGKAFKNVCLCVCLPWVLGWPQNPEEGTRSPGAGAIGSCQLPSVGARSWTKGLCKEVSVPAPLIPFWDWVSLSCLGWSWSCHLLVSAWVVRLQARVTMPAFILTFLKW